MISCLARIWKFILVLLRFQTYKAYVGFLETDLSEEIEFQVLNINLQWCCNSHAKPANKPEFEWLQWRWMRRQHEIVNSCFIPFLG